MVFRLLLRLRPVLVILLSFLNEGVYGRDVDLVGRQGTTVSGSSLEQSSSVVTSTSSAATVTPSAILTFDTINQLTTCTSTLIVWFYLGPESPMSLTVTNLNVPQSGSSSVSGVSTSTVSPGIQALATVTVKLAAALDPTLMNFTWPAVNVPQGWYRLYAGIDSQSFIQTSAAFFVSTGSNTSCLVTGASTLASHPLPSSSTTTTPILVAGSSSSINTGAIVGIVIGSFGLLFVVAAIFFCLLRRRKVGKRNRNFKGGGGGSKGWNGLKSTDSHAGLQAYNSKSSRHSIQEDSLEQANMGSDEGTAPEDKFSPSPGKYGSPYEQETGVSLATLPTLQHSQGHEPMGRRLSRSYSQASTSNSHNGYSVGTMEFGGAPPIAHSRSLRGRRPSVSESVRKASFDSPSYPPPISTGPYPSPLNRSTSTGGATQPSTPNNFYHHHQQEAPLQSPVTPDAKKANRASLGGGSKKRKPVPAYEDHELELSSQQPSPVSPTHAAAAAAFPDLRSNGSDASLRANGNGNGGHYTTRSRTRSRPGSVHSLAHMAVAVHDQELVHKSSFGPGGVEGKPLHYLIPDMPMQQ